MTQRTALALVVASLLAVLSACAPAPDPPAVPLRAVGEFDAIEDDDETRQRLSTERSSRSVSKKEEG